MVFQTPQNPERWQLPVSFQPEQWRVYRARSGRLAVFVGHARPSSSTEAYLIAVFPLRVWAQRLVVLHAAEPELSKDMRFMKHFYGSAHTTQRGPVTVSVHLRNLRIPFWPDLQFLTATCRVAARLTVFAIFGNRIGLQNHNLVRIGFIFHVGAAYSHPSAKDRLKRRNQKR